MTDKERLDWLSTATVGRELVLGGYKDGTLHWVSEQRIAGIDAAMERERTT
jgi:aminoglycoside phosphotransferase